MNTFNSAYKNSKQELLEAKKGLVDRQHIQIVEAVKDYYAISSFSELTESEREAYRSLICDMWNPTEGMTEKGRAFLNEERQLNDKSTPEMVKKYINDTLKHSAKEFAEGKVSISAVATKMSSIYNNICKWNVPIKADELKSLIKSMFLEMVTPHVKRLINSVSIQKIND